MKYGKRWQFYRTQSGVWGLGFSKSTYDWGFQIGPFWIGRGYQ